MKKISNRMILIPILALFSFSVLAELELSATDIRSLFSGNTATAYHELKQARVSLFYDENGEVRGIFANGKMSATKWWVKDNGQICLKSKSGDLCFVVIKHGNKYQKYLVKGKERILAFSMEHFSIGNTNQY